jgi:hypothetical protein
LIVMNFSDSTVEYSYQPSSRVGKSQLGNRLLGNYSHSSTQVSQQLTLKPWEVQVIELKD